MARLYSNNYRTTLNGAITNVATTITVTSVSGLPAIGSGEVCSLTIDDGTNIEIVQATAVSGSDITVVRGQEGTSGTAFSSGAQVELRATANSFLPDDVISGRSLTAATVATDDKVLIQDTSDSDNVKTSTAQSIADLKVTELAEDATPALAGNLDGGGNDVTNVGQIVVDSAQNFGITTGIFFGDGDTGIYEAADDTLYFRRGGAAKFVIFASVMESVASNGWALRFDTPSTSTASICPSRSDTDTGLGWAGADQLSLIAGSVEGIRIIENGGCVIGQHVASGLTADPGSAQGGTPLTSSVNEISTCATAGDSVTLPSAISGLSMKITIINNGANSCDVFPASGDDLGAGVNAAVSLAAGSNITYLSYDDTNWVTVA